MVLPSPREVDECIRTVRKGDVATVTQLRETLARKYAVEVACPLVTGIFVRIAAEAAEEDAAAGKKKITPYWRILQSDGSLNPRYPGGVERQEEDSATRATRLSAARAIAGAWRCNHRP